MKNVIKKVLLRIHSRLFVFLSDERYIKIRYYIETGRKLNLQHPTSFNEKLQWLKLYNRREEYSTFVDKLKVKKYVASLVDGCLVVETLGVYNDFDEINFDALPNQFVLKTTHGGGGCGVVICKDKRNFNYKKAKKVLTKSLSSDIYLTHREWPYKNVVKRIIAEKYISDFDSDELKDYKFFCFNGRVKFFKIDFDRFIKHRANYYDCNGELLEFGEQCFPPDFEKKLNIPEELPKMIEIAEKLSAGIPFLRVDLYNSSGRIYFGEMTFFPASGFGVFSPEETDDIIGNYLTLP